MIALLKKIRGGTISAFDALEAARFAVRFN